MTLSVVHHSLGSSNAKGMKFMKKNDLYEEEDTDGALESLWVKTWKIAEMVRARLVVQDCYQGEMDQDTVFASTPTLVTLRVLNCCHCHAVGLS